MKCSKCYFENPTNALCCNGCSHILELACKFCGKENPPESRFCNGCGNPLVFLSVLFPKDFSSEEKMEKIRKYLPSDITKKILSQRRSVLPG